MAGEMGHHVDGSRKRKGESWGTDSGIEIKKSFQQSTQELKVIPFANSHALEIKALTDHVQTRYGGKLLTQKLPRHMRRRAMSHNIKRLPRQLQPYAKGVYANQEGQVRKRPSRYHRRRPKNLLAEYQRRSRKHIWLETHIWHAKRFHMVDKWGFKLPWKPTDKNHRAAYRATKNHCLLQDMSYMCCLELSGDQTTLINRLSHLTSTETGQTFASKACLPGTREGSTVLYELDQYPWKAVGPVTFMWNPLSSLNLQSKSAKASKTCRASEPRILWIWCHPCMFVAVWRELIQCLGLREWKVEELHQSIGNNDDGKEVTPAKKDEASSSFMPSCISSRYKTDTVAVNKDKTVSLKSLTGSILRYRLTGPQAITILTDLLKQANVIPFQNESNIPDPWWKEYYSREAMALSHGAQREFMERLADCQSPAELSPHCIIATTVQDPRLGRPTKRIKIEGEEDCVSTDTSFFQLKITPDLASSPLWDEKVRNEVAETKTPDYRIWELKSELLIPGTPLDLGEEESKIPVVLIQRPGVSNNPGVIDHNPCPGYGSGWDLLLPKSWGMPFWLGLVFRGARCGGLLEQECSVYEEKSLLFPHNYPDTSAGLTHQSDSEDNFLAKYNRTPPAKRPNFTKLGVPFPYNSPWDLLIKYWKCERRSTDGNENIVKNSSGVAESLAKSSALQEGVHCNGDENEIVSNTQKQGVENGDKNQFRDRNFFVLRNFKVLRRLQLENVGTVRTNRTGRCITNESVFDVLEKSYMEALIAVRLEMTYRGVVEKSATICVPSIEDITSLIKDGHYGGPLEPKHPDPVLIEKKKVQREMKEKGIKKKVKVDRTLKKVVNSTDLSFETCSRQIIGFVCNGGFSLGTGTGGGVGFVSAQGLVSLVRNSPAQSHTWTVLVRNTTSLQYRFAKLCIIT